MAGDHVSLGSYSLSAVVPDTSSLDGEPRNVAVGASSQPRSCLPGSGPSVFLYRVVLVPPPFRQPALGSEFPEQSRSSQPRSMIVLGHISFLGSTLVPAVKVLNCVCVHTHVYGKCPKIYS